VRRQATDQDLRAAGAVAPRSARRAKRRLRVSTAGVPGRPRSRWAISVGAGPDCDRCLPDHWEIQLPTSARLCLSAGDRAQACCVAGEGHRPFKAAFSRPIRAPGAFVEVAPGPDPGQDRLPPPRRPDPPGPGRRPGLTRFRQARRPSWHAWSKSNTPPTNAPDLRDHANSGNDPHDRAERLCARRCSQRCSRKVTAVPTRERVDRRIGMSIESIDI
jgi:hypothetical protein